MINLVTTLNIGFSLVVCLVLSVCYLFFLKSNNKRAESVISCLLFLLAISAIQVEHLSFLQGWGQPLETTYYRALTFLLPPLFYFFSRFVLFPDYQFQMKSLLHFLPIVLVTIVERDVAIPLAFLIGLGYCLWLVQILYRLREHRNRFEIEFFFFVLFAFFAAAVLVVGFSASYIDDKYFYYFYANGISFAYILVTAALIIYPDLLNELTEAVKLSYTNSTLNRVDIEKAMEKLESLMRDEKLYQNESLNLTVLAELMSLTSHQLSELVNTQYGVSFSQYLREVRIERAKYLLKTEKNASILSISLDTGFKSQSNFYAAFKELSGMSPGAYRKSFQD